MTELEFARLMRELPALPTPYHRAVLGHILIDNDHATGQMFALAYGAMSRVGKDRIRTVTLRQLQDEYGMPKELYICADPKSETIQ